MKRLLPILSLIFIIAGCNAGKVPANQEYPHAGKQLPKFKACNGEVVVEDPDFTGERNFLESGEPLSYSHTYLQIHHNSDSIVRERVRKEAADLAETLVRLGYPTIEIASDTIFRYKSYSDISNSTVRIVHPDISESRRKKFISELITPATSQRQLFIQIKTYHTGRNFRNLLNIFVFDTKTLRLLYYDHLAYNCDIRDKTAFSKVLDYAIGKLLPGSP